MKLIFHVFLVCLCFFKTASALQVSQKMKTSIGLFDACEQTLSYSFFRDRDYDFKTMLHTTGVFGTLYPFSASYHAVGTYHKQDFRPQDYFYETKSAFRHRSKEIVYKDGVPQYRVSVKNEKKRTDKIVVDNKYDSSIDLLSTFAALTENIIKKGKCDMERYSFNGKKYALSKVKTMGKEKIQTPNFSGKALKCEYHLEILDDADAGFLLKKDEPIYFWVLRDEKTDVPFVVKIYVENTPFGKLESITTEIEVIR